MTTVSVPGSSSVVGGLPPQQPTCSAGSAQLTKNQKKKLRKKKKRAEAAALIASGSLEGLTVSASASGTSLAIGEEDDDDDSDTEDSVANTAQAGASPRAAHGVPPPSPSPASAAGAAAAAAPHPHSQQEHSHAASVPWGTADGAHGGEAGPRHKTASSTRSRRGPSSNRPPSHFSPAAQHIHHSVQNTAPIGPVHTKPFSSPAPALTLTGLLTLPAIPCPQRRPHGGPSAPAGLQDRRHGQRLLDVQAVHLGHSDAAVPVSGGHPRRKVQHARRHVVVRVHHVRARDGRFAL